MSERLTTDGASLSRSLSGPARQACDDFQTAWNVALRGGPVPELEQYANRASPAERPQLRFALEQIEQKYRPNRATSAEQDDTLQLPPEANGGGQPASDSDGTIDFPPAAEPAAKSPLSDTDANAQTITLDQAEQDDPNATLDPHRTLPPPAPPTQESDATVNLAPDSEAESGATMDLPPPSPVNQMCTVDVEEGRHVGSTVDLAAGQALGSTLDRAREQDFSLVEDVRRQVRAEGQPVPGYEILGELGRGGMGVVYKARQIGLKRVVALKMVLAGAHATPDQLARFNIEAEAIAKIQHPNIVQIYDIGEHGGLPYFSLEFCDGGSLSSKLGGKPLPPKEAAELLELLSMAMACAHGHNIIHRDLKPANILLNADGLPKITDFGLAKKLESDSSQTKSGQLMGTPSYMAPEQARGETHEVGPLADVYSLGAILYECLTGRPPFLGAHVLDTLHLVRNQEPVPPTQLQPTLPVDLETICLKCLQKEPAKRYQSADELAGDLHRYLSGEPILARPIGHAELLWRWCKRNPKMAAAAGVILLLLVTIAVGSSALSYQIAREKDEVERQREEAERAGKAEKIARGIADENARLARTKEKVASEQRDLALKAWGTVVGKVEEVMGDAPHLQDTRAAILKIALDELKAMRENMEKNKDVMAADQSLAVAHKRFGYLYRQLGHTEEAFAEFLAMHEILANIAKAQPEDDRSQANLASSYTMLGEMALFRNGDNRAAREYYQRALELRKQVVEHPQEHPLPPIQAQQDLANAYYRLGDVTINSDPADARGFYGEALRVRRELQRIMAASNQVMLPASGVGLLAAVSGREPLLAACAFFPGRIPVNLEIESGLADCYMDLGKAALLLRDRAGAQDYYENCLKLREVVHQAAPRSMYNKLLLAYSREKFGDFWVRTGDPAQARVLYARALEVYDQMIQLDPKDQRWQMHQARATYRDATAALLLHESMAAADGYRKALETRERLAKKDPRNQIVQRDYLVSLARSGDFRRTEEQAASVRKTSPKDPDTLLDLARAYALLSAAAAAKGAQPPASAGYRSPEQYAAQALEALAEARTNGFHNVVEIDTDPDLEPIRESAGFKKLQQELVSSARP